MPRKGGNKLEKHEDSARRRRWREFVAWWVPDLHNFQSEHDDLDRWRLKVVIWFLAAAGLVMPIVGWRMGGIGFGLFMGATCVGLIAIVALIYRFRRIVEIAVQLMLLV